MAFADQSSRVGPVAEQMNSVGDVSLLEGSNDRDFGLKIGAEERCLEADAQKKAGKNGSKQKKKFVGVRQRPSGRWVAEIKDSTQKLRLWLGTFDNAEDAARAYDDAARALRGANTRTNFKSPANGSARLSRATRLLLQRVAMRSSQNTEAAKENHAEKNAAYPGLCGSLESPAVGFSSELLSKDKVLDPSKCVPPQQQPSYATSFGFQSPLSTHQMPNKSAYGAFIQKMSKMPKAEEEFAGAYVGKHAMHGGLESVRDAYQQNLQKLQLARSMSMNATHHPTAVAFKAAHLPLPSLSEIGETCGQGKAEMVLTDPTGVQDLSVHEDKLNVPMDDMVQFQDGHQGALPSCFDGGQDYMKSYSASSRFMSSFVTVSPSTRYKVAPSIHVYPTTVGAGSYATDVSESEALIRNPNICGSESPIILNNNDVTITYPGSSSCDSVSPRSGTSTPGAESSNPESFWSYFDQALCAVS